MIELLNITKKYGALSALKNVSLTVRKGQVLGLLGQNGAGKTTTLNILTGYLPPNAGQVKIGGFDMLTQPRQAKRMLGYLPEKPPLYDEMTVDAYLRFCCALREVQNKDIAPHVDEICGLTGLSDVRARRIAHLSKGYRQRVGLAQALCGDPEALVLDEPTIGLDPKQTAEFRALIHALGQKHTIIFSSHILAEVQAICDRVVILHHGEIIFDRPLSRLSEGCGTRLRASIAMGEGALMPALRSLSCVKNARVLRGGEEGVTEVVLECEGAQPQRPLFTLLSGLQAPILRLSPMEDTLEDVFLRTTQ